MQSRGTRLSPACLNSAPRSKQNKVKGSEIPLQKTSQRKEKTNGAAVQAESNFPVAAGRSANVALLVEGKVKRNNPHPQKISHINVVRGFKKKNKHSMLQFQKCRNGQKLEDQMSCHLVFCFHNTVIHFPPGMGNYLTAPPPRAGRGHTGF